MLKNMILLEFSNLSRPFLRVTAPAGEDMISFFIELSEHQLHDGCITDIETIASRIERECPQKLPICLSLACEGVFRSRFMLPKMSAARARMLFRRERSADKHAADHYIWEESFAYTGGHVFDRYYLPRKIAAAFQDLAAHLGVSLAAVEPAGVDVMRNLDFDGNFAYFYIRRNVCTMLLCDSGRLLTTYDFSFETAEDIRRTFLLVAGKYELELDKKPITHYGVDSDIPFLLDMNLYRLTEDGDALPEAQMTEQDGSVSSIDLLDSDFEHFFDSITKQPGSSRTRSKE